jgi:hypothetical protein
MTKDELHIIATRFLTHVEKDSKSDCLLYLGAKRRGYGAFRFNDKTVQAHRASYLLFKGPIPKNKSVSRLCHNKECVKPSHLKLATHTEIIRRAFKEGKFNTSTADRTKQLKLDWAQADQIRNDPRNNCTAIAKDYGLSRSTVSDIRRGKTWNRERRKVKL